MSKLMLCGRNRINLPERGCSDCEELAYRISQLEEYIRTHPPITYTLESDGNTVTLVGSDGTRSEVSVEAVVSCN